MSIASGDGFAFFGHPTVHWPPGFPAALGAVYGVFGPDIRHGLVLDACLGAATVPLAYLAALRVAGRAAAVGVGAALALMPGQALLASVLLSETLYTFELVAFVALVATLKPRPRSFAILGLVAGVAALTRGEGLLFPVIVLGALWVRGERRRALRGTAIVVAVMLATVAPWTVRNALTVHAFVPVSTNASDTLWSGHNPAANGGPVYALQTNVLSRVRRGNYEVNSAALLRHEAFEYALHHPLRELKLIPLKLRSLVRGDSELIRVWINSRGQKPLGRTTASVLGTLADVAWFALLAATIAAVGVFRRELWAIPIVRGVLAFLALAIPLYGFVYYGNFRYRLPLEPLMLLVVATAAAACMQRAPSGRFRRG
jgi:4-amino-4-deoxy-L-arabinose transferase-like glycosyltransferase